MKGDPLPELDHVARHCRYAHLVYEDGQLIGVNEAAFLPRPADVSGISVNWIEFFLGPREHKIDCIRSITKLKAKDNDRIAVVEVNALKAAATPFTTLTITHDPDGSLPPSTNAAHALLGPSTDLGNKVLREQLATKVHAINIYRYR